MIKGMDMRQRIEFVSKYDTEESKTVFVLRPLSGEEQANLKDKGATVKLTGTQIYDFLSTAVVEIRNFNIEGTIREQLNSITDDKILTELIEEIGKISFMTKQDEKN